MAGTSKGCLTATRSKKEWKWSEGIPTSLPISNGNQKELRSLHLQAPVDLVEQGSLCLYGSFISCCLCSIITLPWGDVKHLRKFFFVRGRQEDNLVSSLLTSYPIGSLIVLDNHHINGIQHFLK